MKKLFKTLGIVLLVIVALLIILVQRIDRTPYQETPHFAAWQENIRQTNFTPLQAALTMGWAEVNITPAEPIPMSGYGNRWGKAFESVRDSIYIGSISLASPEKTISLVSADMLIVPPNVTEKLGELLEKDGISLNDIHLGATHTHHSIGSWGQKLIGRLFSGKYDPETEQKLAEKFRTAILESRKDMVSGKIQYLETKNEEGIRNRLEVDSGQITDPEMRNLIFTRDDGKKAALLTYGAHSTMLPSRFLALSRDYPGQYIAQLEDKGDFDFALYFAGAVGSMGHVGKGADAFERASNLGGQLTQKFLDAEAQLELPSDISALDSLQATPLFSTWIKVPLPPSTGRISLDYALRPWVFSALFGKSQGDIKVTLIGHTLLLGMPADFSGEIMVELDQYAREKGLDLIITSFNGYYTGYITHDKWYEHNLYETVTMSWNGYDAGNYYTNAAENIIDKIAIALQETERKP